MINANELRIGNYIADVWASEKAAWQVKKFTDKKVWYGAFNCKIENAKPVSITEKWLIDFDFIKSSSESDIATNYFFEIIELSGLYFTIRVLKRSNVFRVTYNDEFLRTVKYVHELQNLAFAISGIELKLKKPE